MSPPDAAPTGAPLLTPPPGGLGVVRPPPRHTIAWLAAVWLGLAGFVAWRVAVGWAGVRDLTSDLVFLPFYPAAGLACAVAARASAGRLRRGYAALAVGWLASFAGELLYLAARARPESAAWLEALGDGLDALYYPLAAVAFLALSARPRGRWDHLRLTADGLLAAAAAATLAWYFVIRHLGPDTPWLANLESVLGSGAGEVVILFAAATALARPAEGAAGPALQALAGGALALALGDLASAQHGLAEERSGTSLPGDVLLVLGTVLSASGGLLATWPGGQAAIPRRLAAALRPLRRIPALAVAAVLVVLALELLAGPGGALGGLAAATAGFAVLVMARLQLAERALEAEAAARAEREQRLRNAQKLEMLGLLTGGVAHDFANLLASLGGLSASMRDRHGDEAEELDELDDAVVRGRALCQRLLAMGRRDPAQPAELDPREVVEELLGFLRRLLPQGVELLATGPLDGARIRVERAQLELAVMNLVVNARDAMPAGGTAWIRVEPVQVTAAGSLARRGVPPGRWARLAVADSGVGMDAQALRRASEPFFTTKPEGQGTGLGLATVRAMVEAAGGMLLIDSARGRGTVVTLLFPLALPRGP